MERKEKTHELKEIRDFYKFLMKSELISNELLRKIILYGGTVPYILADAKEAPRKFGDVDMYISSNYMAYLRNTLCDKWYFNMVSDSKDLVDSCSSEDYGFKGKLFGVDISVFPIYEEMTNSKLNTKDPYSFSPVISPTEIRGKSFNVEESQTNNPDYALFDTIILQNSNLQTFSRTIDLYGGKISMIPLEYTVASKQMAMTDPDRDGKKYDKKDIEFIHGHFSINPYIVKQIKKNSPQGDKAICKVKMRKKGEYFEINPAIYGDADIHQHYSRS